MIGDILEINKTILIAKSVQGIQPWDFFGRNDAKAEILYFGHLMLRVDSLEKTLMLGGIGAGGDGDDSR